MSLRHNQTEILLEKPFPSMKKLPNRYKDLKPGKFVAPGLGDGQTPLQFLLSVVRDEKNDLSDRVKCACAALPYCHPRVGETYIGKKDIQAEKARIIETGDQAWGDDLSDNRPN